MCVLAVLQVRTCVCVFCFVLFSLALFYLSCVMFRLLLRVLTCLAIFVTIYIYFLFIYFFFFFFFFHTRMCASALMQTRTGVCVFIIITFLAPTLPTTAYVVFTFLRGRVLHIRICVSASVPIRTCVCFLIYFLYLKSAFYPMWTLLFLFYLMYLFFLPVF